ncbi:hypothetical protein [Corynebacterium sp. ACRPS]|uniref:hypothetical protein n=1 Tax=Corynebacterium sp. ACRPS TaxID=2918194 RepID=UPI001EF429E1|nr:hypothetical protein [Corynebacterium sp. ACRPS]
MSDLTTTNLKHLLDQATPGPWKVGDTNYDVITYRNGDGVLWNADQAVDWSRRDEDVSLAALAPELAQEVIRLRAPDLPEPTFPFDDGTKGWFVEDDEVHDIASIYIFDGEVLLSTAAGRVKGAPAKMRKIGLALLAATNHAEENQ